MCTINGMTFRAPPCIYMCVCVCVCVCVYRWTAKKKVDQIRLDWMDNKKITELFRIITTFRNNRSFPFQRSMHNNPKERSSPLLAVEA